MYAGLEMPLGLINIAGGRDQPGGVQIDRSINLIRQNSYIDAQTPEMALLALQTLCSSSISYCMLSELSEHGDLTPHITNWQILQLCGLRYLRWVWRHADSVAQI